MKNWEDKRREEMFKQAKSYRPELSEVRSKFIRLITSYGIATEQKASDAFEALLRQYGKPERFYHNFDHILDLLGWLKMDLFGYTSQQHDIAFLAILYHDAIYNTSPGAGVGNEAESAAWMILELYPLIGDHAIVGAVAQEILATDHSKDHQSSTYVRDYDLVGLAKPWSEVATNTANVRKEYANLSDAVFSKGQFAFFGQMLLRPEGRIFDSALFSSLFESQARANITRIVTEAEPRFAQEETV